MKIICPILVLASSIASALAQVGIAWEDTNPPEAFVTQYRVYLFSPSTNRVLRTVAVPLNHPYPFSTTNEVNVSEAGKVLGVTAVNSDGIESPPPIPTIQIPPLAEPPTNVVLAFNFTARTMEVLWVNPNPSIALVSGFRLYQKNDTKWDKVFETTNATTRATIPIPSGTKTFAVSAVNPWGESVMSVPADVPVVMLPVANLRLITTK